MEEFQPRKFKFKAWNTKDRLLMKLSSIDCRKGELFKKEHILLQFTGLVDKLEQEIYEMDILLVSDQKFLVRWHNANNGWYILPFPSQHSHEPLVKEKAGEMKRLCNYFEANNSI